MMMRPRPETLPLDLSCMIRSRLFCLTGVTALTRAIGEQAVPTQRHDAAPSSIGLTVFDPAPPPNLHSPKVSVAQRIDIVGMH